MNILDAFYHTVHDYPGGSASLAPRMGVSPSVLNNKADPRKDHNKPLLMDAQKIMSLTGDTRILDALAASQGGVFIKLDSEDSPAGDMAILEMVTQVWKTNGQIGAEIAQAFEDGKIEKHEVARIREAIYGAQKAMESLIKRLEGMSE